MTVPAVRIEDYETFMYAVGPDLRTVGEAVRDDDGRRWWVKLLDARDAVSWHTSKAEAIRELRVRAGRLFGSPSC